MDVLMDPVGVETLFDQILEYKMNYWYLVIDWLQANGVADRVSVVSECDDLGSQSSTLLDPGLFACLRHSKILAGSEAISGKGCRM